MLRLLNTNNISQYNTFRIRDSFCGIQKRKVSSDLSIVMRQVVNT